MAVIEIPGGDGAGAQSDSDLPRLTRAEDAEMRQLAWFAKAGHLSERSQARLAELRARDRRETIRDPRPDPTSGTAGSATRFLPASAVSSSCPNCGFGRPRSDGSSSSCPNCGFSAQGDTDDHDAAASSPCGQSELPVFGSLDKEAFRSLLLNAAKGGVLPEDI